MKLHQGIWLPDHDTHFAGHLDKGPKVGGAGTYQHEKLTMAMKHCPRKRTALDIGAHVGLWSRSLAREFNTVIAFEPVPEHIECFKANLKQMRIVEQHENVSQLVPCRVHLYPFALGAAHGTLHIATTPDNSGNAHILTHGHGLEVEVRRLDDYLFDSHSIDFIKIDVEGFELDVIKGAQRIIMHHKPTMVVEQKPGHGMRYGVPDTAAVDLLRTWGAKQAWVKNGDYCMVW